MKKLLFLLLFPLALHAQKGAIFYPGEYSCLASYNGVGYDIGTNNVVKIPNQPAAGISTMAAALHTFLLVDKKGLCYTWGDNNYGTAGNGTIGGNYSSPILVATDSAGNPF